MRHTGSPATSAFLLGLLFVQSAPAHGQETAKTPSLGEVARQLKAEREKEKHKPAAVFTNDNLPSQGAAGISTLKAKEGEKEQPAETGAPAAAPPAEEHGEKYFRSRADNIRSRMDLHRRHLAVLQQQLGLTKMQYFPDPQKTLEQESTPAFQSDLDKLRAKIADTQKAIAGDQQAMDGLRDELRHDGGDPGWIR